jgi:hypothetical protein
MPFPEMLPFMHKRLHVLLLLLILPVLVSAQDTTKASASLRYDDPGFGQRIFLGSNYRDAWSTPVTVRIFRLSLEKGGLTPKELGGGMQTKSLQLKDQNGKEYVLRSLDKDVAKAMEAEGIKNSRVRNLSQNMISAAHPYGSLTLPPLARAVGVLSTNPELVYVPDEPGLGQYRSMFAKTMCFLEEREPVIYAGDEVKSSEKLHKDLEKHKDYKVDQKMLLQARLLDMLVADWDRHDDQWKWEYHKNPDGSMIIYPIPKDHDQAYFNSTGMLFGIMRTINTKRFVGFREGLKLKPLNYKQWAFDSKMLKDLSEEDWRIGTKSFQEKINDAVIEEGMRRLPPEVYASDAKDLAAVLKARRDSMLDDVMSYYRFLKSNPEKIKKQGDEQKEKMKKANKLKNADKDVDDA